MIRRGVPLRHEHVRSRAGSIDGGRRRCRFEEMMMIALRLLLLWDLVIDWFGAVF